MTDDGWDGVIETAGPNPLLRLAGGLLAAGLIVLIASTDALHLTSAGVLGSSLLQTALLLLILYVSWLRGAASWKPIAATTALFVLIMIINLGKAESGIAALKTDASTLSELSLDAQGNLIVPPGAEKRGPLSRITLGMASDVDALTKAFHLKLEHAGMFALFDADRLQLNPAVLRNCGSITAVKADISGYKARHLAIIDRARGELSAIDMPPSIKKNILAGMDSSLSRTRSEIEKMWGLNAQQIDEAGAVCIILARRNWQAHGDVFAFTAQRDLDAFNRHNDRLNALGAQLDEIARGSRQRMMQSQQDMKHFLN